MAHYRHRIFLILSAILTVWAAAPPPSLAQYSLEGIVIESAGLQPSEANKLGSAYTVITAEDLQQRQIRNAGDALRAVAGVNVSRSGGPGQLTDVRIRGAEANHAIVLIDGVEVSTFDFGGFDFSLLSTADIERIEVLRGAQSGVYGANALAGVINIITRKGTAAPQVSASAEAGSFNTRELTANATGGSEKGYFSVSAARRETDGFNISRNGDENDGSKQETVFARAGVSLTPDFRVDGAARFQSNEADVDNFTDFDFLVDDVAGDFNKREQSFARISAELDLFDKRLTTKVFADYFDEAFTGSSFGAGFRNEGDRMHYGLQSTLKLDTPAVFAKHAITALIEQKDETFATGQVEEKQRGQTGMVAEYKGEYFDRAFITANLRRDLNETFEDATTYRLAAAYLLQSTATRLHASYGKGITNPTFFEQFGRTGSFSGNPDLLPEQSIGWDAGVEQAFLGRALVLDVTYFQADLTDEIVNIFDPVTFDVTGVENAAGKSEREGVEVQLTAAPVAGVQITGTYTYLLSSQPDGRQESRRPRHSGGVNVAYSFDDGRGTLNFGALYNGEIKDLGGLVTVDDYVVVNLAAAYRATDAITVFGRLENALDEDYEEIFGYSTAPFAAYGGIKITFAGDQAPLEAAVK